MPEGLDQLAKGIGKAIQTVPELYQDAFQPTVQETGKLVSRIPRAINAAFSGLDKWILNREYSIDETKKLLAQKLENVDPEKIITPEAYVAVPAIQAISYSMDSKELRNLYANLLAKSMNIDTKDSVHPSFVEIIKQLSPIDANVFSLIMRTNLKPLIDIRINLSKEQGGGGITQLKNISWITDFTYEQYSVSFDNLERLKLIEILDYAYTHKEHYTLVTTTPDYVSYRDAIQYGITEGQSIQDNQKIMEVSGLGKLFYNVCVI